FGKPNAPNRGFDIGSDGDAFAGKFLQFPDNSTGYYLVSADLKTGVDSSLGPISDGQTPITDIAILPSLQFQTGVYAAKEGKRLTAKVTRTEGDQATLTVHVATVNGKATAGQDFKA